MKIALSLLILFLSSYLNAQNYNVALIPDSLKQDANVVKRMEELRVTIKSDTKVIVNRKYAVTILNSDGDEYAEYSNNYSSLQDLSNIDGTLYDASGNKLKSVKRKDIEDESTTDGFSLMLDDRIKKHHFYHRQYPYTVVYEDEQELKSAYFLPFWFPVEDEAYSVQQSKYIVEIPIEYELRYKQLNMLSAPTIHKDKTVTYTWELNNFNAAASESFQPAMKDLLPIIYIAPKRFTLGQYKADMSTWKDLGKLQVALNAGRTELPDKVKTTVHELTDALKTTEEKTIALYRYLQKNTRYISVQLGIGGWQPFDAKYVATNKYGDCKALSNYMVSLLKEAGVKANYVLVTAGSGRKGLSEDFPAPYFNHVITCVPNGKDTIWLECTSQSESPGYLGTFTGDRKVLLIDEDGGHVVTTPVYKSSDNLQLRKIIATIDESGHLTAQSYTHFTGTQQEEQHSLIHNANKEQRERYLNSTISLPTYKVDFMEYKESQGRIPVINEILHISAPNFATVSGKRLFVTPNFFNKSGTRLSKNSNRNTPIQFNMPFEDVDTVEINIPKGYIPEAMPKSINISNSFADFSVVYMVKENQITLIRKHLRKRTVLPATAYDEVADYFDAVYKSDHSRIVFVKKEGS